MDKGKAIQNITSKGKKFKSHKQQKNKQKRVKEHKIKTEYKGTT